MNTIIFLGPPGSGKGTQAKKLAKEKGFFHISMGRIFRDSKEKYPELSEIMKKGDLVPDNRLFSLLTEHILRQDHITSIILDGTPRSLDQYNLIKPWFAENDMPINMVIYIKISESEAIRRLSNRRTDPNTDITYNLVTNPPPASVDVSKLTHRADDNPESIKERFNVYHELTEPVLDKLRKEGILTEIDGERDIEEIFEDIKKLFA